MKHSLIESVSIEVFREALELLYGGQEDAGWELLRMAQRSDAAINNKLLKDFRAERHSSRHWKALARSRQTSRRCTW